MTAATPEQAAHAAACVQEGVGAEAPELWQLLNVRDLRYWKAVSQAAIDAQVAAVFAVADGGTVLVAFKDPLTRSQGAEIHERWTKFGPAGVKLAILDDVAAVAAQQPQPAPELALRSDAETAAMLRADLADAEAQLARWPKCPAGCSCRIGIEDDPDRNECGCDGPCNGGEQPAPERFAAEVRRGPCNVAGHEGEHFQWRAGDWVCGHVLAASLALSGVIPPQPIGTAWRLLDEAREQLAEIGVMAANAPEDGDSFGLLEEIAMRIAAADVPDCLASHCPPSAHADCEYPKCAPPNRPSEGNIPTIPTEGTR